MPEYGLHGVRGVGRAITSILLDIHPTQAYFWPAVNKRLTRLCPRYFLTQPGEIFLTWRAKSWKNLGLYGEIFQCQTQTKEGWPDPYKKHLWPRPVTTLKLSVMGSLGSQVDFHTGRVQVKDITFIDSPPCRKDLHLSDFGFSNRWIRAAQVGSAVGKPICIHPKLILWPFLPLYTLYLWFKSHPG